MLSRPFLIAPNSLHPSLSLGDYFQGLYRFLTVENRALLEGLLDRLRPDDRPSLDSATLTIKTEKHGALYHVAVGELDWGDDLVRFGMNVAVGSEAAEWLDREFAVIAELSEIHDTGYLPELFFKGETRMRDCEVRVTVLEWFEGYHEWHLSPDGDSGGAKVFLWDYRNGFRCLSREEEDILYRRACYVLTSYLDPEGWRQIFPWSHAAGDFVVKAEDGSVQVRLITARDYRACLPLDNCAKSGPFLFLVYFVLDLTLRMRLDRCDGVGEFVWKGDFPMSEALRGVSEALDIQGSPGRGGELMALIVSFGPEELMGLVESAMGIYGHYAAEESEIIKRRLRTHAEELSDAAKGLLGR